MPDPHATSYQRFGPGEPLTDTTIAIRVLDSGADGSMISTATEINRFLAALIGGRLLAPAQLPEMQRVVELSADSGYPAGTGYGLGVLTPLTCDGGYSGHGGTDFGHAMEPAVTGDARRRLTVSIFTNTFDPDLAAPRFTVLTDLIDHALCR